VALDGKHENTPVKPKIFLKKNYKNSTFVLVELMESHILLAVPFNGM
jgi:hypothetical protein